MTLDTSPSPRNANPYLAHRLGMYSALLGLLGSSRNVAKDAKDRTSGKFKRSNSFPGPLLPVKRGPGNEVDPVLHRPPLDKIPKFCQIYYARYLKLSWAGILSFDELTTLISSNRYLVFEVSLIQSSQFQRFGLLSKYSTILFSDQSSEGVKWQLLFEFL